MLSPARPLMRAPSPVVAHGAPFGIALRAALAVERVILQAAEHAWPVDFGGNILALRRAASSAAVDGGLFAALDHAQHVGDQVVLVEAFERGEDPEAIALMREKRRGEGWLDIGAFRGLDAQPALNLGAGLVARLLWRMLGCLCRVYWRQRGGFRRKQTCACCGRCVDWFDGGQRVWHASSSCSRAELSGSQRHMPWPRWTLVRRKAQKDRNQRRLRRKRAGYALRYRVEDDEASYETSLMLCRAAITSDTGDKENPKALVVTGVSLLCSCAESR